MGDLYERLKKSELDPSRRFPRPSPYTSELITLSLTDNEYYSVLTESSLNEAPPVRSPSPSSSSSLSLILTFPPFLGR